MKTTHILRNALLCFALCLNATIGSVFAIPVAAAPTAAKVISPTLQTVSTASISPSLNSIASSMNITHQNERNGLGKECYSFAHYVFNTVFKRENQIVGSSQNPNQHRFSSIASDVTCLGTLNLGEGQGTGYAAS